MTDTTRNGICHTAVSPHFSFLLTADSALFTFSAPLFPSNPLFSALRSSHELSQWPSPQKQIPSNRSNPQGEARSGEPASRNAIELDSATLHKVGAANLPDWTKPANIGEAALECSRWAPRGDWSQRAGKEKSSNPGEPAGAATLRPKSDGPIVVRKGLTIPHDKLMACVRMRETDSAVLELIRGWLRAPIIETDEKTGPGKCYKPMPKVFDDLNAFLRGWSNYFEYGYPRKAFRDLSNYTRKRIVTHLNRRSQRKYHRPKGMSHHQYQQELELQRL